MKNMGKYIYITAIMTCFIIVASQMVNVFNGVKAAVGDNSKNNSVNQSYDKVEASVSDIVKGLGTAINYAVFANTFHQQSHMEGNIAVKNAYIGQIFNFTNHVLEIYKNRDYSITVTNKVDDKLADGTFKFGLFTKQTDASGKSYYAKANHDIISVTTKNGEGTATFSDLDANTKYYIFELDENNNPIMNNTVTAEGVTVMYEDDETSVIANEASLENVSYIENIIEWTHHAADGNVAKNPKLVIPMTAFLGLYNSNNDLTHYNSGIVLTQNPGDFELVVIAEKDFNDYDKVLSENGFTNSYKYNTDGTIKYVASENEGGNIIYTLYDEVEYDSLIEKSVKNSGVKENVNSYSINTALEPNYEVYSKVNSSDITPDFTDYINIDTIEDVTNYEGKDLSKYIPNEKQKSTYIKFDTYGNVDEVVTVTDSKVNDENVTTLKKVKWTRKWENEVQVESRSAPTYVKIRKNSNNEVFVSAMKKVLKQYKLKDGDNYTVKWNGTEYDLQDRKNEYEIINFEKEFGNLNDFSKNLYNNVKSSNTVSVINLDADGTIYENGQVNGLNNSNAASEILDLSNYLADGKYLVINVDMSGLNTINLSNQINWGDLDGTYDWNSLSTRVLWNFYNKDSNKPYDGKIEIGKKYILGTMLAPSANVIVRTTINASIIANEASNPGGEIHKSQFASVQKLVKTKVLNKKVNPKNGSVSIRVTKVDSTNNNKLANAKFVIVVKDGEKEIARKTDVTNDLGVITLDKIEISSAGKKYTVSIKEANAPSGYNPNEDIEFEVESILKENKYVLKPVSSYNKNGDTIVVGNEYIDVTVPNLKITGTYGIKLIKRDEDTNSLLNNMTFDITAVDSNNNKVSLVSSLTGKEIDLSKLVTGEKSDDGVIEVKDINISGEQNYKLIINERLSGNYNKLEPIKVNVQTKLENGKYVLGDITLTENRNDVSISKKDNIIQLEVKNKKIEGSFGIQLIKSDKLNLATRLKGAEFEITITKKSEEIYKKTETTDENGYISIPGIKIENENDIYNVTIKEKIAPEGYSLVEEPISFNVTTTKIDGEYKLQPISQQIFNNAKVNVNKNLIQIDVTNDKKPDNPKVEGKYDVLIQKINSETKEGLNGVKIHVEAVDSNEQSLINKDYTTEEKEGKNGYVQINDISILKSGVHKYKIEEIETVNGYVKFEKPITFEAEVGLNSKEDAYTIKSVKNIGDYSGEVKIEYNEDSNNLIIVLPNDPTKEAGDLALRKFITSVNEKSLDTSRVPVAKMNNVTRKIEYMQTKKEVEVNVGDYILYTLRVYNEGKTEGTASLIKDYLPKGLEFVNNNIVNNQYNWKMLDKDGKVTNNSNDAVFIATDYLNGSVIPAYSGEGTPSYLDVKVVLKVTQEAEKEGRLVNIAFIGEDNIEDKDSKPDNTILPDKFSEYKKEEAENSSVTSVINGVEDDEDFENVKIKRPSILPQTGEASSMIKCGVFVIIGMILITFAAYFIYRKF